MSDTSNDTLIQALQNEDLYDHPVSGFEVVETHISWIILAGEYAYKIKKPVNFGFLDFSSLELRHKYCLEEVRLNRRYSPDLYLGVVAIHGTAVSPSFQDSGEAIEYAVKMKRFPGDQLLSRLSERDELTNRHIDAMAKAIAEFHETAGQCDGEDPFGAPSTVYRWAKENFEEIRPLLEDDDTLELLDRLESWTDEQFTIKREFFEARKGGGFVRECHGDLHLGNMFAEDDRIRLFDCIEFNEELRRIDVICEAAFVFMDLCDRGREEFAWRFLNHYLQQTGDYAGLHVLPWYVVYRALVRAKVILLRLSQGHLTDAEREEIKRQCRGYMELAQRSTDRPSQLLVITRGLSGSGKSWLAEPLAGMLAAVHIRSDIERKRIHGYAMEAKTDSELQKGIYSKHADRSTYCHMALVSADCIDAGYSVIVDATFLKQWQRDHFRTLAEDLDTGFVIIDLQVPVELLRERVEQRQRSGEDVSEADTAVLDNQLSQQEALTEEERRHALEINAAGEPDWQAIVKALEERRRPRDTVTEKRG
ncbi:MAG: AAA family ATPase [Gammaproteobacteria bacterium]